MGVLNEWRNVNVSVCIAYDDLVRIQADNGIERCRPLTLSICIRWCIVGACLTQF
jgi:hypothetical protein